MNRNRPLALESLEGKTLLSGVTVHPAVVVGQLGGVAQVGSYLPHGPSSTTGFTAFASGTTSTIQVGSYLPHGPSSTTGFSAF